MFRKGKVPDFFKSQDPKGGEENCCMQGRYGTYTYLTYLPIRQLSSKLEPLCKRRVPTERLMTEHLMTKRLTTKTNATERLMTERLI